MPIDPVCGMIFSEEHADEKLKSSHGGKTYQFCSEECKEEFDIDPEMYVAEAEADEAAAEQEETF